MRTLDFDALRSEQRAEPLHLILGGKTYDLPPSIPASVVLDVIRLHLTDGDASDVPVNEAFGMLEQLFGGDTLKTVLRESGLGLNELPDLLGKVVEQYLGSSLPNREARRASHSRRSKNGRSWRPTSSGSTASTSRSHSPG